MKFHLNLKVLSALFLITIVFANCKKGDTGAMGAAGATGAAGTNGAAGATGATGAKGDTGTANVIYSHWFNLKFVSRESAYAPFSCDTTIEQLDSTMLATGEIKVYCNYGSASSANIFPLPYNDSIYRVTVDFYPYTMDIYSNFDGSTYTSTDGEIYQQYRYILIPGSVLAGRQAHPDWKDYNAVKAFYHIKD